MRVYSTSAEHLQQVSQLLRKGEVVAIPTETVYGLAADALNAEAVVKIYEIKGRPEHNPLIIHVPTLASAERYVVLNPTAEKLMLRFWPGPLTLVLPKMPCIPSVVTAGLPTVGIRCPRHPAMQSVLQQLDRPIAAPSANPSNYISPTRVEHVLQHLTGRLEHALDGGPCESGVESTIVDLTDEQSPKLLRPGPISVAEIEKATGIVFSNNTQNSGSAHTPTTVNSPGQLKLHYSPRTPLTLLKKGEKPKINSLNPSQKVALLTFSKITEQSNERSSAVELSELSKNSDHREAEGRLYETLQQLDRQNYAHIYVESIPEGPQWLAIRDRLTRAANR